MDKRYNIDCLAGRKEGCVPLSYEEIEIKSFFIEVRRKKTNQKNI